MQIIASHGEEKEEEEEEEPTVNSVLAKMKVFSYILYLNIKCITYLNSFFPNNLPIIYTLLSFFLISNSTPDVNI